MNPWDLRRSSGPSSTGIGAGISAALAVIGIGTDTSGSIMNPSSFCGLFGLRSSTGVVEIDGIFPNLAKSDAVGPLTKYIDDLVLTYSIMSNKKDIYEKYLQEDSSKINIGIVEAFWNNFNISYELFGDFTYKFDEQVYETLNNSVNNFAKLNYKIIDIKVNQTEFNELNQLSLQIIITGLYNCIDSCYKASVEKYLNDAERFQSDSPYNNYQEMLSSPLLSEFWHERFNRSNFPNPDETCRVECETHDLLRSRFVEYVNAWFSKSGADVLLFPTSLDLAFFINSTEPLNNASPTFIAPYTGLPSLNIPVGFSKPDKYAPDGLPIGLMMITQRDNLLSEFKLAKVYEKNYPINSKLPELTPRLFYKEDATCNRSSPHLITNNIYYFILFVITKLL